MNEPKTGETYLVVPNNITNEWFGTPQQKLEYCAVCGKFDAIGVIEGLPKDKIIRCDCKRKKQ
jgi:hypothetical protein